MEGHHSAPPVRLTDRSAKAALARALGDSPETVAAVHRLTCGFGDAWVIDGPSGFMAAAVQDSMWPAQVYGFCADPAALTALLVQVPDWSMALVGPRYAEAVRQGIAGATGSNVTAEDEIYFLHGGAFPETADSRVHQMAGGEADVIAWLLEWGFTRERLEHILRHGVLAYALVDDRPAAAAFTDGWSAKYAEVTVASDPEYRSRGLGTAAAGWVCRKVVAGGKTPVWSTTQGNLASLRIAARLGFVATSRLSLLTLAAG